MAAHCRVEEECMEGWNGILLAVVIVGLAGLLVRMIGKKPSGGSFLSGG